MNALSLISAPKVESYQDAVSHLKMLESQVLNTIGALRKGAVDLIRLRWEQGQVASMALKLTNARMDDLAEMAGVHSQTLYNAKIVYERFGTRVSLETAIRKWEEEGRDITWNMALSHARKRLPDGREKAESALQEQAKRLEKRAEKLEADAIDLEERALHANGQADELFGIAAKAREVAGDTRRQAEEVKSISLPKPERIEASHYLQYIRTKPCLACGEPGVHAHHLERGGMGTKGPDMFTVPLCGECHGTLHQIGDAKFWGQDYDPWRSVAHLMLDYFSK